MKVYLKIEATQEEVEHLEGCREHWAMLGCVMRDLMRLAMERVGAEQFADVGEIAGKLFDPRNN